MHLPRPVHLCEDLIKTKIKIFEEIAYTVLPHLKEFPFSRFEYSTLQCETCCVCSKYLSVHSIFVVWQLVPCLHITTDLFVKFSNCPFAHLALMYYSCTPPPLVVFRIHKFERDVCSTPSAKVICTSDLRHEDGAITYPGPVSICHRSFRGLPTKPYFFEMLSLLFYYNHKNYPFHRGKLSQQHTNRIQSFSVQHKISSEINKTHTSFNQIQACKHAYVKYDINIQPNDHNLLHKRSLSL